jgi:hypothetical protein
VRLLARLQVQLLVMVVVVTWMLVGALVSLM